MKTFREFITNINEGKDPFAEIKKYMVDKDSSIGRIIISINFEDEAAVDAIIKNNKELSKMLNFTDSTGRNKKYYFDV
jgi:glutamate formiminotransferase